jgi:hypothetical protein
MTIPGNGQPPSYEVSMSGETRAEVKRLHRAAVQAGTGQEFISAFKQILERLEKDPLIFGEPLYHLSALKLAVRKGAIAPLVVVYGVHDEQPQVFIRGFKMMSQ